MKVTINVNTSGYGNRIDGTHVQVTGLSMREVETGLKWCIESLERELSDLRNCPYHKSQL
jgi:hypothetical protein